LLFSALNLFRQSFVFSEVEIEDVKFVHKKNLAFILVQRFQSQRRFSSSRFAVWWEFVGTNKYDSGCVSFFPLVHWRRRARGTKLKMMLRWWVGEALVNADSLLS
jgi:hypothetical protein